MGPASSPCAAEVIRKSEQTASKKTLTQPKRGAKQGDVWSSLRVFLLSDFDSPSVDQIIAQARSIHRQRLAATNLEDAEIILSTSK